MVYIKFNVILITGHEVKIIQNHLTYDGDKSQGDNRVRLFVFLFFNITSLYIYTLVIIYLKYFATSKFVSEISS